MRRKPLHSGSLLQTHSRDGPSTSAPTRRYLHHPKGRSQFFKVVESSGC